MRDPNPENISGSKVQKHEFKHVVNWGHVTLGLVLILLLVLAARYVSTEGGRTAGFVFEQEAVDEEDSSSGW